MTARDDLQGPLMSSDAVAVALLVARNLRFTDAKTSEEPSMISCPTSMISDFSKPVASARLLRRGSTRFPLRSVILVVKGIAGDIRTVLRDDFLHQPQDGTVIAVGGMAFQPVQSFAKLPGGHFGALHQPNSGDGSALCGFLAGGELLAQLLARAGAAEDNGDIRTRPQAGPLDEPVR